MLYLSGQRRGQQVMQSDGHRRTRPVTLSKEVKAAGSQHQQDQFPAGGRGWKRVNLRCKGNSISIH